MGVIRLTLALAVVFAHAGHRNVLVDSGLAVQAFYIISGFYMSLILTERYRSDRLFYLNRALRLFPSYILILALSLAFVAINGRNQIIDWNRLTAVPDLLTALILALANLFILAQDIVIWFGVTVAKGTLYFAPDYKANLHAGKFLLVPQAWSISLELMFYALAPFLATQRVRILVVIAAASLIVRFAGNYIDVSYDLWPRRFFPAELCLFLFGMIAHRLMVRVPSFPRQFGWIVLLGLVLLLVVHHRLPIDSRISWALLYTSVSLALPILFRTFKSSPVDQFIGELSYPVYLVHFLIIGVVDALGLEWRLAAILSLTMISASAIYLSVDRPISRFRHAKLQTVPEAPQPSGLFQNQSTPPRQL